MESTLWTMIRGLDYVETPEARGPLSYNPFHYIPKVAAWSNIKYYMRHLQKPVAAPHGIAVKHCPHAGMIHCAFNVLNYCKVWTQAWTRSSVTAWKVHIAMSGFACVSSDSQYC